MNENDRLPAAIEGDATAALMGDLGPALLCVSGSETAATDPNEITKH